MKKKSVKLHKAQGTYRPDRHEIVVTHQPLTVIPEPYQERTAVEIYKHYAQILLDRGLLFAEDVALLETFAHAMFTRDKIIKKLGSEDFVTDYTNTAGETNPIEHPGNKILKAANETIIKAGTKLGFNLVDKDRIKVAVPAKDKKTPMMTALE